MAAPCDGPNCVGGYGRATGMMAPPRGLNGVRMAQLPRRADALLLQVLSELAVAVITGQRVVGYPTLAIIDSNTPAKWR